MKPNSIIYGYGEGESIQKDYGGLYIKVGYAAKRDLTLAPNAKYGVKNYTIITDTGTAKTIKIEWYDGKISHAKMTNDYFNIFITPQRTVVSAKPKYPTVECPYCHSTDTTKITTTSKAVHTAFFGIFSMSRNSKQWHCNDCGSDF